MAEEAEDASTPQTCSKQFLEVVCKSSGKIRRFAVGTKAGFAVRLINQKLDTDPFAAYIEADKQGEEPISFGPSADLDDYGDGWKLQTVLYQGFEKDQGVQRTDKMVPDVNRTDGLKKSKGRPKYQFSFQYLGRVLLALLFIVLFGFLCVLALENLPRFILFVTSQM